jgi:type I restriction enzyme S subunit
VHITKDVEFVFQRHIAILRPNREHILPRYMYHTMQSTDFYKQANSGAKGAAQRTIGLATLGNMTIPVPPLDVQERLVSILDRFDTLCNDITSGLPAEIEVRKRQYEYYRDKLLDFRRSTYE